MKTLFNVLHYKLNRKILLNFNIYKSQSNNKLKKSDDNILELQNSLL